MTTATTSEKRGNLFSNDPMNVGIIGGLEIANEHERGPLDTADDPTHELSDIKRLRAPLDEPFYFGVEFAGVKVPITCKKYNGVLFVVVGRKRLRAARRANIARAMRGEPPMVITYIIEASNDKAKLAGLVMLENNARTDDDHGTKVDKLRAFMERYNCDLEVAAHYANEKPNVLKAWLAFDESAIDDIKAAVYSGQMSISAGIEISRAGNPEQQAQALQLALGGLDDVAPDVAPTTSDASAETPRPAKSKPAKLSARAARQAAKTVSRPNANQGVGDRRTQMRLLQALRDKAHNLKAQRTLDFFEGAENMLTLIMGGDEAKETDVRLVELLRDLRKAMKAGK